MKRAIISGVAGVTPLGNTLDDIQTALIAGKCGIQPYRPESDRVKSHVRAVADFDDEINKQPEIPRSLDERLLQMASYSLKGAVVDSGLILSDIVPSLRTALVSGVGYTSVDHARAIINYKDQRVSPFSILNVIPTAVSGPLASIFGFKGPTHTVQHACATGVRVLTQAFDLIQLDRADVVVCVSSEAFKPEFMAAFDATKALYRGSDTVRSSVPFSKDRSGFVMGEGAAAFVVESEDHYRARGGTNGYGEILGYADYSDGEGLTSPSGVGAKACLTEIKRLLNGRPVDMVNAHATSTKIGDKMEAEAISEAFGNDVPVTALKSQFGHGVSSASAQEILACLLMMRYGYITATPVVRDPELPPINLLQLPTNTSLHTVVKNAFGFGGLNAIVALGSLVE